MTLLEMKQRRSAILAELKTLRDAVKLAGGSFTPEQRAKVDELTKEDAGLKEQIKLLEADAAIDGLIDGLQSELSVVEPRRHSQVGHVEVKPPEQFKSLGQQLQAIAGVALSGRHDNRLTWESLAPATGGAVASVPADGGYAIQKDFVTDLMNKTTEQSMLWSRVRKVPIGPNSDGLKVMTVNETSRATGSRWGGVQVYWGAEADAATAKKPQFRLMEMELKDLIGLAYATDRLLADASALEAIFMQAFSEEIGFMLDDAVYNGTGAGQPLGILNAGCVVSVAKESGQAAATLVWENVNKMWSRMWARSRGNAVWFINQDVEPQLHMMSFPVGTGGVPVYLPAGGASQSPYATLMGRPVVPIEHCATLGTTGDIMLADLSQYLGIEKGAMQADSSIHVRFTTNEKTFRFITRADGQPLWNSALTPFKGSNTQSPFVKLDTRS